MNFVSVNITSDNTPNLIVFAVGFDVNSIRPLRVVAQRLGLLSEVVAADQLDAAIERELADLLQCAPGAVAATKKLVAYVQAQLLAARDAGAAVLVISDDLDEVLTLGDRVAVMHAGHLTEARPAGDWSREAIGLAMAGVSTTVSRGETA